MMADRVSILFNMLPEDGVILIAIDDEELYNLKKMLDETIGEQNYISTIVIQSNPRGRGINSFYATCHEYCLCYARNPKFTHIANQELTEEHENNFKHIDNKSAFRLLPFRRSGGYSTPNDRPNSEFPLYFDKKNRLVAVGGKRKFDLPEEYVAENIIQISKDGEVIYFPENDFNRDNPDVIKVMPIDTKGNRRVWRWSDRAKILTHGTHGDFVLQISDEKKYVQLKDRIKSGRKPKTLWYESKYDASSHGTNLLKNMFGDRYVFGYPKSIHATTDCLLTIIGDDKASTIIDPFGGSATTAHAVLNINRLSSISDEITNHKYIIVEMGAYFSDVTLPRTKRSIYSDEWKDGKPLNHTTGVSHIMKYIRLESYEDTLSNIELNTVQGDLLSGLFGEEYLISYLLNTESVGSLLNIVAFKNPFNYKMKINENNETKLRPVDLVETFNYLIGLRVVRQGTIDYYRSVPDVEGTYEGAVRLIKDAGGEYAFQQIDGILPEGQRALVIWRMVTDDLLASNAALDAYFERYRINPQDREYDIIYVNGDSNLENMRTDAESWKVAMTELAFKQRMFEEE